MHRRVLLLVIVLLLLIPCASAQTAPGARVEAAAQGPPPSVVIIEPPSPVVRVRGKGPLASTDPVRITYRADLPGAVLHSPRKLTLRMLLGEPHMPNSTVLLPLAKKGENTWEVILNRDQSWPYAIFYVADERGRADTNGGKYWEILTTGPDGQINGEALGLQASTYTLGIFGPAIQRKVDYARAVQILESGRRAGERDSTMLLYYKSRMYGDTEEGTRKLAADMEKLVEANWKDARALNGLGSFVASRSDKFPQLTEKISKRLQKLDPKSRFFEQQQFMTTIRERDASKRAALLSAFIEKYPNAMNAGTAHSTVFRQACAAKDLGPCEQAFERWRKADPHSPQPYISMVGVYLDQKTKLDESFKLLTEAEELKPGASPEGIPEHYLAQQRDRDKAQIQVLRGRALLLKGDKAGALSKLEAAHKLNKSMAGLHLGRALEENGKLAEAADVYFEHYLGSRMLDNACKQHLDSLYAGKIGTPEDLKARLEAKKLERRKEATAKYTPLLIDLPAPDFDFSTLKGERLTSAALRGKTVILNFWGIG